MDRSIKDQILQEFTKRVQEIFPDIPISGGGYGFDFHVNYGISNSVLKNSQYYLDPTGESYFHLTSYRNLFSILNSGNLRMYNLTNSDDPNELNSFKDVGFNDVAIAHQKENIFTFSFCHINDIDNQMLWKKYGKVAIVFEFKNSPNSWNYFHLSNIKYNKNRAFRRYFKFMEEFESKYMIERFNHESIRDLIAFHKKPRFAWEREVRLMHLPSLFRHDTNQRLDFKTSKHHTGFTKYVDLPLFVDSSGSHLLPWMREFGLKRDLEVGYYDDKPLIKITNIKFGDNESLVSEDVFRKLHGEISHQFFMKFGYEIPVDLKLFKTRLTD